MVRGNAAHLRQVVMNLIINASEALEGMDGVIAVSTSLVALGHHLASGTTADLPPGDYVRLEVTDSGRGMTEEVRLRILIRFSAPKVPVAAWASQPYKESSATTPES